MCRVQRKKDKLEEAVQASSSRTERTWTEDVNESDKESGRRGLK